MHVVCLTCKASVQARIVASAGADPNEERIMRLAVVRVPEGFDDTVDIAGLPVYLRQVLALQSAGATRVVLWGAADSELGRLRSDRRVHCELSTELRADDAGASALWVTRADYTFHRAWPQWAMTQVDGLEGGVSFGERDALVFLLGTRVAACVEAMRSSAPADPLSLDGVESSELAPGMFCVEISRPAGREQALREHLQSLIKPTGGVIDRKFMRPISLRLTRRLCDSPVTPNVISLWSLLLALLAAGMAASTEPGVYIAAGIIHFSVRIFDCVDGELARLRYQSTAFGQWLDTVADGIGVGAFVLGVTYKTAIQYAAEPWWILGGVGLLLYALVQIFQLAVARRTTGGGSVQAVEWSFQRENARGIDRLVGSIHNFVRIDFISTVYALLVIVDAGRVLLVAHLLASAGGTLYLVGQLLRTPRVEADASS